MNSAMRVVFCALVASVVPPTLFSVPLAFIALATGEVSVTEFPAFLAAWLAIFLMAWLVALAHIVTLGLPAFFILRQSNLLDGFSISLAGFIAGAAPVSIFWPPNGPLLPIAIFGLLGLASALAFWRAWVRLGSCLLQQPAVRVGRRHRRAGGVVVEVGDRVGAGRAGQHHKRRAGSGHRPQPAF